MPERIEFAGAGALPEGDGSLQRAGRAPAVRSCSLTRLSRPVATRLRSAAVSVASFEAVKMPALPENRHLKMGISVNDDVPIVFQQPVD
jgi:hypothetical protein